MTERNNTGQAGLQKIPIFLLKTRSTPNDSYEEHFGAATNNQFDPVFLRVLDHRFRDDTVSWLRLTIFNGGFASPDEESIGQDGSEGEAGHFGGLIFTSQRAVEAFSMVVNEMDADTRDLFLPDTLPLYVVGPATARGVRALNLSCPVLGEETGNGEALAHFMLDHYNKLPRSQIYGKGGKLPLLFLVGEQRRDIIPNTLQSSDLPEDRRTGVDERVVYETGEMESFGAEFQSALETIPRSGTKEQWVVVFSPTGCKAMLRTLGWLDESTGRYVDAASSPGTFVATIGPTTRDYLVQEFGFEPHVCAAKPSPEGVLAGIEAYRAGRQ